MISIIIILKNEIGIIDTVTNLNNLDYKGKIEIVVIDRSTIIYPKIVSKIPIRWIRYNPNGKRYTIPEQRNIGIRETKGNIIVFIDANCVPNINWLTELVRPIYNDNEKIVMGKTGSIYSSGKTLNDLTHINVIDKKYVTEAPTLNLAVLRNVFKKVGYFDEKFDYGSDSDFTWRAIDAGYKIRFQPNAIVYHNWGDTKREFQRTLMYGKGRIRLLIKHRRTRWKRIFLQDGIVFLYPVLILGLPIAYFYPWYLLIIPLLVIKNIQEPNPIYIVMKHIIYGMGVLLEIINQLLKYFINVFRKYKI